ncbi:MAG: hypothetical protein MUC92_09925 [Fimbriimonadaceae bacterium]|jgi:hypothetical protein|nr:hypothetical protein [Fimbriimonadaceae bacterium]
MPGQPSRVCASYRIRFPGAIGVPVPTILNRISGQETAGGRIGVPKAEKFEPRRVFLVAKPSRVAKSRTLGSSGRDDVSNGVIVSLRHQRLGGIRHRLHGLQPVVLVASAF